MSKRVRDVNWHNSKFIRAGIIPIVKQGNTTFFGFGVENGIAAIGDFGGHKENTDCDALDAAIREYREESLNAFGEITRDLLQDCYVLEGLDTAEILFPVSGPLYQYTIKFHELVGNNEQHEVQNVIWLSRKQLLIAIDSQETEFLGTKIYHMYTRIRDVIHRNRDLI